VFYRTGRGEGIGNGARLSFAVSASAVGVSLENMLNLFCGTALVTG